MKVDLHGCQHITVLGPGQALHHHPQLPGNVALAKLDIICQLVLFNRIYYYKMNKNKHIGYFIRPSLHHRQ